MAAVFGHAIRIRISCTLLQTSRPSAGPLGSSGTHPHGCASRGCWQRPGGRPCLQGWGTHPPKAHAFVVVGALSLTPPLLNRPSSAPRRTAPFASTAWSPTPAPTPVSIGSKRCGRPLRAAGVYAVPPDVLTRRASIPSALSRQECRSGRGVFGCGEVDSTRERWVVRRRGALRPVQSTSEPTAAPPQLNRHPPAAIRCPLHSRLPHPRGVRTRVEYR
jgi:hypothetical protein